MNDASYSAQIPRLHGPQRAGFIVVVALHALIGLALLQGLARTAIESIKPPPIVRIVRDPVKPSEPPVDPVLPRPRDVELPVPIPPDPGVFEIVRPAEPTIRTGQDPAPTPAPGQGTVVAPQPWVAPPVPRPVVAEQPRFDASRCAPRSEDYPVAARRAEAAGTTRLRFTINDGGGLVRSEIVRSAGPTREHKLLDKVAESKLGACTFSPGIDENGRAVGGSFEVDYVWKIEY